jgi:hypothetical protein
MNERAYTPHVDVVSPWIAYIVILVILGVYAGAIYGVWVLLRWVGVFS